MFFEVIFDVFSAIYTATVVGEQLCDLEILPLALKI